MRCHFILRVSSFRRHLIFFSPQKSATQQYFSALRFESSSALNIEIGENSLAYFDDNKLRASV